MRKGWKMLIVQENMAHAGPDWSIYPLEVTYVMPVVHGRE